MPQPRQPRVLPRLSRLLSKTEPRPTGGPCQALALPVLEQARDSLRQELSPGLCTRYFLHEDKNDLTFSTHVDPITEKLAVLSSLLLHVSGTAVVFFCCREKHFPSLLHLDLEVQYKNQQHRNLATTYRNK